MKKRLSAALLCLCMALTLMPVSALASLDAAASLTVDGTALVEGGETTGELRSREQHADAGGLRRRMEPGRFCYRRKYG